MRAKKSLGQNFLVDGNLQRKIVEALGAGPGDEVLEIGPGRGALTRHLAGRVGRLVLVELDDALAAELADTYAGRDDVAVVHGDVLDVDLPSLVRDPARLKVVGNIPYNITTPIVFRLLERPRPAEILVMVQREVADRILAEPGTSEYGALAVGVRSVADVERALNVPRTAFRPVPRVDSAVVRIRPTVPEPLTPREEDDLRTLVRAAFQWRRKQLQKILRDHPDLGVPAEAAEALLEGMGLDPRARPETLAPGEFIALSSRAVRPAAMRDPPRRRMDERGGAVRERRWLRALGLHRPELRAWAMYDWANSAFATTIMAAVLPIFYVDVAAATRPEAMRTAYWAYTQSVALLVVALISPVLGAVADFMGAKKRFLAAFMGLGVTGTALLFFVGRGDWLFGSALFVVGNLGFGAANVFYDSLLPHVANEEERDRVSTAGYAMGYVGGGLLLALNLWWILAPATWHFSGAEQATRASFVSVAVWWAVFSVPLLRMVREPPPRLESDEAVRMNPVRVGFTRVIETLGEVRQRRQAFLFLLAFWLYNDGVGTIIKMATAYGAEVGIDRTVLIGTLLVVQFVGIPFAFAFGALADRIGTRNGIYIALAVYTVIACLGYFLREAWQFVALGVLVATVQGGVQALSRSLFASLIPSGRSSEFFGFYSVSSKFAGLIGPLLFGVVTTLTGGSRLSIVSLIVLFVVGGFLLSRVDVEEGRRQARAEDRALETVVA